MDAERRRLARAEIGIDLARGEQFAERPPGRVLLDGDGLKQRQRVRMAVAADGLDRALHPADFVDVDAELMHQVAAQPDRGGLRVERQADALALKVLRCADAGARVDEDIAVAEHARRKDRNGDELAFAVAGQADELGSGQLRGVEFLAADHAVENGAAGREDHHIEIDAFDRHFA